MKTVIQVVQHLVPGGIETMALELKKSMPADTHMLIVSLEGKKHNMVNAWRRLQPIASDIICMEKKPGIDIRLILRLVKLFRHSEIAAIHTHHIGPLLYAGVAARIAGVNRLVHTEHDAWHLEDKKRRCVQRLCLALTKPKIIADSATVAKVMQFHLDSKKIEVIRNGIDVRSFQPGERHQARKNLGLRQDLVYVGSSGRLELVKGHTNLIHALVKLPDSVHLALAGTGSQMQSLHEQAKTLGVSERVHFLGHINDMPNFYQALDVFCLPSLHEGMPLAPLEAQACGIPAVISDTGGSSEALCRESGQLVPPGNSHELAEALIRALTSKTVVNPRNFVERSANLIDMANAYAEQYEYSPRSS